MIGNNSCIYTDNGVFKIDDLYELSNSLQALYKPKIMTIDIPDKETSSDQPIRYKFTSNYRIIKSPKIITDVNMDINYFHQIFECKFTDIFSDRTVTANCTEDTYILQYNVLKTDDYPIANKNYGVLKYLQANRNKNKLNLGWKMLKNLLNYSTYKPNICLGDTITKFISKEVRNREIGYEVYNTEVGSLNYETLPIFICQNISTFYNFILVKGYNKEYDLAYEVEEEK